MGQENLDSVTAPGLLARRLSVVVQTSTPRRVRARRLPPAIRRCRNGDLAPRLLVLGPAALLMVIGTFGSPGLEAKAQDGWAAGITESVDDALLSSPVAGIVAARPFAEGAVVKKGEVVLELDSKLEELEARRRELLRAQAKRDLERIRALAERNAISVTREELEKKESDCQVAGVEYELAIEQCRRRKIQAPFDGTIAEIVVDAGEGCQPQQAVVRLVDTRHCYFVANVEMKVAAGLKHGQRLKLEIDSGSAPVACEGTVSHISPVADPASGLVKVKVRFENADGRVRPGGTGRMQSP